jgi:DNA polymerase/3'-5' exonuclease PolX
MNSLIIGQFEKLIEQIKRDIDNSKTKEDIVRNSFRLKQVRNSLRIIKDHSCKINKGEDIEHLKGIGKGTVQRINEILKTGKLSEIKTDTEIEKMENAINSLENVFGIGCYCKRISRKS